MEETSELINFALNDDIGARVVFQVLLVMLNFLFENFALLREIVNLVAQLENSEEALLIGQRLLLVDAIFEVFVERSDVSQRL